MCQAYKIFHSDCSHFVYLLYVLNKVFVLLLHYI